LIKISVIIPTYNRLERLILVFEALRCQTLSPHEFEVIVVSDGSCDGTDDYLHSLQVPYPFTPIFQPNQGVAVARNQGLAQAKGEVVLFLDDDVIPADHLVAEHLLSHESSNGDLVIIGSMITPEDFEMSPWVRWEQDQLAKQYQDMLGGVWETTARQFYTGNTSLSRMRLLESGGFDPEITRAEDVELAYLTQHKKRTWLLPAILKEYNNRNPLTRGITRLCLGKPLLSSAAKWGLKMSMEIGDILKMSGLTHISCSGIFNLQHYQGIADELGGRKAFYDALNQANNRENLDYSPALPIDGNH
jgi:glycosyltransferase involved in cell wall biosynthesis